MIRVFGMMVLVLGLGVAGLAVRADEGKDKPKEKAKEDFNLELELPESVFADWGTEYGPKIEIDGKDYSRFGEGTRVRCTVMPKKGKETVTVKFTFWPFAYSKTVRTKIVKIDPAKVTKVSLAKEDKATPDEIYPIYVPTPQEVVDEMCKLAKITKNDVACDIGCGDGRLCITAVKKFGAKKAIGWDIAKERIDECIENAKKEKVTDKVVFEIKDALKIKDFSDVTVVFLYVGEDLGEKLEPVLRKTLKPGARVVSHRFPVGGWKPDREVKIKAKSLYGTESEYTLLLWEVGKPKRKE